MASTKTYPSVGLLSLGCARNLVDSEVALGTLIQEGFSYCPDVAQSDIAIINTCGFTAEAKQESIDAIMELVELKKKKQIQKLVIMGCLSQRYGSELADQIKEADVIVGTNEFGRLAEIIKPHLTERKTEFVARPKFLLDQFSPKKSLTPEHYAYIKISEGCINACSYCAIPSMKGKHRSRPIEDIVAEVDRRVASGKLKELNLIGQDVAAYGYDLNRTFQLGELMKSLSKAAPQVWIRSLYAHPAHVEDDFIDAIRDHDNLLPYVDLPIEHSHPDMLKRMNRGVTREVMDKVIADMRKRIPLLTLRTALIVGFPGETEEEFRDLLQYMEEIRFDRLGAFTCSQEEGTRAFGMEKQIPDALKQERYEQVMDLQASISLELGQEKVGKDFDVLIDEIDDAGQGLGRSYCDAPEVDGHIRFMTKDNFQVGDIVKVKINEATEYDLVGEAV